MAEYAKEVGEAVKRLAQDAALNRAAYEDALVRETRLLALLEACATGQVHTVAVMVDTIPGLSGWRAKIISMAQKARGT